MDHQSFSWRVEPGDAVGMAIRIPRDHLDLALEVLGPAVNRSSLASPDDSPTFYLTQGNGTYKERVVTHKFVSIICNPPPWASADPAYGFLAIIAGRRDRGANFFWQYRYNCVIGKIKLKVASDLQSARAQIVTAGGILQVNATFSSEGEPWSFLPNNLYGMDPGVHVVRTGDEWGIRHDGTGIVSIQTMEGRCIRFETYVGLDTQLGWDYVF